MKSQDVEAILQIYFDQCLKKGWPAVDSLFAQGRNEDEDRK